MHHEILNEFVIWELNNDVIHILFMQFNRREFFEILNGKLMEWNNKINN